MKRAILWVALLSWVFSVVAAVRELEVDDKSMHPIWLKMGKSGVIRFPEKPQQIVVGNKNYFNIEFIGSDLAIQPQRELTTNLFVYGNKRVYGFLLIPALNGPYDDLVKVRWKRPQSPSEPSPIRLNMNVLTVERIKMAVEKIFKVGTGRLYGVDVTLKNTAESDIFLDGIEIKPDSNIVKVVERVCPMDTLRRKSSLKCRIFFTYNPKLKGVQDDGKNKKISPRKFQRGRGKQADHQ